MESQHVVNHVGTGTGAGTLVDCAQTTEQGNDNSGAAVKSARITSEREPDEGALGSPMSTRDGGEDAEGPTTVVVFP